MSGDATNATVWPDADVYWAADPDETMAMLDRFYEKRDPGRAGEHETEL